MGCVAYNPSCRACHRLFYSNKRVRVRIQNIAHEKVLVVNLPSPMRRTTKGDDVTAPRLVVYIKSVELYYNPNSVPERFVNIVPTRRTRSGREFA